MLNGKTVIVLGAGSSKSFGLPVGFELLEKINNISKVRYDFGKPSEDSHDINFAYFLQYLNNKKMLDLSSKPHVRVAEACLSANSIDDFIDFEDDKQLSDYCKAAISYSIIKSEFRSSIKSINDYNQKNSFDSRYRGQWIERLFLLLIKQLKRRDFEKIFDDLVVINFNYDRCVECYLHNAIQIVFKIDPNQSWKAVTNMESIRPYGYIGPIIGDQSVPFGGGGREGPTGDDIFCGASNIKTYTESIDDDIQDQISQNCEDAKNIIFLGFGFHPQNMKILKDSNIKAESNIFSTIYNQSDYTAEIIRSELASFVEDGLNSIHLHDGDCESFFKRYEMGLTRY